MGWTAATDTASMGHAHDCMKAGYRSEAYTRLIQASLNAPLLCYILHWHEFQFFDGAHPSGLPAVVDLRGFLIRTSMLSVRLGLQDPKVDSMQALAAVACNLPFSQQLLRLQPFNICSSQCS